MNTKNIFFASLLAAACALIPVRAQSPNITLAPGGSISQAIDNLLTGGTLYLQSGDYYVNSTLNVNKSVRIEGQGIANTRVHYMGGNYGFYLQRPYGGTTYRLAGFTLVNTGGSGTAGIYVDGGDWQPNHQLQALVVDRIKVENFLIGLEMRNDYNSQISDSTFSRSPSGSAHGVYISTPSMNTVFSGCTISGYDIGIWVANSNARQEGIIIYNCTFSDYVKGIFAPRFGWLAVYCNTMNSRPGNSAAVAIDAGGGGGGFTLKQGQEWGLHVVGNRINHGSGSGAGIVCKDVQVATVSKNEVYNATIGIGVETTWRVEPDAAGAFTIGNNYLTSCATGIKLGGRTWQSLIGQNFFAGCSTNQYIAPDATGIVVYEP